MKIYFNSLKLHLKSELEYKWSFIMSFFSQIFIFLGYYFTIIALFAKFKNLQGYTIYEVLLTFSIINFGFSFCETFARGIDNFDGLIVNGDFDRLLLRPQNILLQVFSSEMQYSKLSRLVQSVIIMIIAIVKLGIKWNILKVITLLLMLISSIIIFLGIFLIAASYCFITTQGLEVRNVITDGGKQAAQYPISIYNKPFRFIFTYLFPYSLINYYPLLYLTDKVDKPIYAFLPLLVIIYLIPSVLIFNKGSKKYLSTGS
jgi:ABC-2 type transport system permease protein